jgi:hypothetical protein
MQEVHSTHPSALTPGRTDATNAPRLDEPANRADNPSRRDSSAGGVTRLSQLVANRGSRPETARHGLGWSEARRTHCKTTKFSRCPTGGQVVAGSNPVSPTQVGGCCSDGGKSTTLQVLLGGDRLYQALGWKGEPCSTLKQFAETAIPRIG